MQLPIPGLLPQSDWRPPRVSSLPRWAGARRVVLDLETRDDDLRELGPGVRRKNAHVCGVAFKLDDLPPTYLPLRHDGGDNVPLEEGLRYLEDQFASFRGTVDGNGLSYDADWGCQMGWDFSGVTSWRDVQVAEGLLDEMRLRYGLNSLCASYGLSGKDEQLLAAAVSFYGTKRRPAHPKRDLWRVPARYAGPYAEADVEMPALILDRQLPLLAEQELGQAWDVECRLLPALVQMRRRGVRVDVEELSRIEIWAEEQERRALERIRRATGCRLRLGDVWSAAIAAPLEYLGVKLPRTAKSGRKSVTKELLDSIDHPVADDVRRAREMAKLRTTFVAGVRKHLVQSSPGEWRMHPTFHQTRRDDDDESGREHGARWGRLSSSHFNFQFQPIRNEEFGRWWRSIYKPEEGETWGSLDCNQDEPRMTAHFAAVLGLPGAREFAERYNSDRTIDCHQMMADITGLPRKDAKICFLARVYSQGDAKLCDRLGLPTALKEARNGRKYRAAGPEGQRIIDKFNAALPFIRILDQRCREVARRRGYIKTILGARCRFPRDAEGNYDFTYRALNRLVQGSCAYKMKLAIVLLHEAGYEPNLPVHDELNQSFSDPRRLREIAEVIEGAVETVVRTVVKPSVGPDWGNCEDTTWEALGA